MILVHLQFHNDIQTMTSQAWLTRSGPIMHRPVVESNPSTSRSDGGVTCQDTVGKLKSMRISLPLWTVVTHSGPNQNEDRRDEGQSEGLSTWWRPIWRRRVNQKPFTTQLYSCSLSCCVENSPSFRRRSCFWVIWIVGRSPVKFVYPRNGYRHKQFNVDSMGELGYVWVAHWGTADWLRQTGEWAPNWSSLIGWVNDWLMSSRFQFHRKVILRNLIGQIYFWGIWLVNFRSFCFLMRAFLATMSLAGVVAQPPPHPMPHTCGKPSDGPVR